jgi:RimJ/RimL family protein N-acetyltransferase
VPGPAYRIVTPRLVVRCWEPRDAPRLKAAIDASLEHLGRMPWIGQEPEPLEGKIARLRRFRAHFDLDQDYAYGIFDRDEREVLGGCGLHARQGPGALEIGYWIGAGHVRRGLASEAAGALTRVAVELGRVARVEIHCGPENAASAGVARTLGFRHEATLGRRFRRADGSLRDTMIWTLFADDYPASPAARVAIEAFGATGERLCD